MKKVVYRLCSAFLAVLMLSVAVVPVCATDDYASTGSFWQNVARKKWLSGFLGSSLIGWVCDDVCSESSDKRHHGSLKSYEQNPDKSYTAICDFCSAEFPVYDADLSAAYDDYVTTLPASGYTSTGGLSWKIVPYVGYVMGKDRASGERLTDYVRAFGKSKSGASTYVGFVLLEDFIAPIDGIYSLSAVTLASHLASGSPSVTSVHNFNKLLLAGEIVARAGSEGSDVNRILSVGFDSSSERGYWYGYIVISCVPHALFSSDTYSTTTRPTSITGGNYGIVGDNGQITKVEDNSTIINETNNTYYNPATGQTVPITGWTYDYSDRSYKVTMEGGKTSTVTYGDENISITETTINESGDTITNNYTIYYLIDGSGSENPPSACDHTWAETSATPATCTMPGSRLSTCSKCQQTKTESLSALGHDWQVKQFVNTEYDETGQLTQEGYIIYECSRCHEQYKAASGTSPPVNPSDPDASGDGVFSGIFGLLLDFLGFFFKTFKDFTKSGVKAFLGALQDGTSDIFGLLNPFDWST